MDPRVSWTAPVVIMITVTDSSKDSVREKTRKHLEDKFRLNYKLSPRRSRVIIIPESKQHYLSDKIGGFGGKATFINEALCWLRQECCNDWQACGRQLDVPEFSSESLHGWWMNAPWISQKGHLAVIAMNWHPQRSPSWRQQILNTTAACRALSHHASMLGTRLAASMAGLTAHVEQHVHAAFSHT